MKVAWLGTGIMGSHLALHLANNDYDVTVYNRTLSKALKLKPKVEVATSIKEAVNNKDIIFTMLGYPKDVNEVINEVFKYAKKGAIIVDMTTSSPALAKDLYKEGKNKELFLLDAPVTGSDTYAKAGTLSIMVGGDEDIFNKVLPLFKTFGKTITYIGESGNGQYAKLANQVAIAGAISGVVESIVFATQNNLDLNLVHQILNNGSAASNQLAINGLKIINNDFAPGFYIKHFLKDLKLVFEVNPNLNVVNEVIKMLEELIKKGYEDLGTQALIKYYMDKSE